MPDIAGGELDQQLTDVTIVFSRIGQNGPDNIYAYTTVYALDYEGTPDEFMEALANAEEFNAPGSDKRIVCIERMGVR